MNEQNMNDLSHFVGRTVESVAIDRDADGERAVNFHFTDGTVLRVAGTPLYGWDDVGRRVAGVEFVEGKAL
jgi:hypothetical protein